MLRKIVGLLIFLILLGCSDSASPKKEGIIYSNSFDKEDEFEGWEGINSLNWKTDVPSQESKYSVSISGGCVIPHAIYSFKNNLESGYYSIECWGKAYPNTFGGGVTLSFRNNEGNHNNSVHISFSDSVWVHKISELLFFDNSADLTIEMTAGGFIASGMLIDELVVRKVE